MATLEELVIQLTAESSQLRAELKSASDVTAKSMGAMEKSIKEFSQKSTADVSFFQKSMSVMAGFIGGNLVLGAFNKLTEFVGFFGHSLIEGAQAAIRQEQALTRLSTSLALSGNLSRKAVDDLEAFSNQMETLTGVQDDAVLSNLALLSSLTRLDAEGLKAAQQAALDFSVATGKDLTTATQMVAKAINGQTDAFGKMGVKISESSDKTQQLRVVTDALTKQFGGAAQAAMNTFAGAVLGVENSFGNLAEAIAGSVTKNPVLIGQMRELAVIFSEWTGSVETADSTLQKLVGGASIVAVEAFRDLLIVVEAVWDTFQFLIIGAQTLNVAFTAMTDGIGFLKDALLGTEEANPFARTKAAFDALSEGIKEQQANSIGLIDDLDRVGDAGAAGYAKIGNEVGLATEKTKEHAESLSFIQAAYNEQFAAVATALATKNVLVSDQLAVEHEMLKANLEAQAITKEEFMAAERDLLAEERATELAQLDAFYAGKAGKDAEYQAAKANLLLKHDTAERKQRAEKQKFETEQDKIRAANFSSTLNTIASLSSSSNKTLASIGKAAAITQATIDGYAAVQKALASAPPPFNFALAALVGAATAANVAKIAGVGLQGGIDSVPGTGNQDNFPAVLAPGERVIPKDSNKELQKFLDNQNEGGQTITIEISLKDALMDFIEAKLLERQATGTSVIIQGAV